MPDITYFCAVFQYSVFLFLIILILFLFLSCLPSQALMVHLSNLILLPGEVLQVAKSGRILCFEMRGKHGDISGPQS